MKFISALQLDVRPRPGQSSFECFDAIRVEVMEWIRSVFRGMGIHTLALPFDGSSETPRTDHVIRTDHASCETHRLASLEWVWRDATDRDLDWHCSITLACDQTLVQIAMLIGAQWRSFICRPVRKNLTNDNPISTLGRVRSQIVRGWKCQVEGQPITLDARWLNKKNVAEFGKDVLLNPHRTLPVILLMLGTLPNDREFLNAMQRKVWGHALVGVVPDQDVAGYLLELVGPKLFNSEAVVHLFWPGLLQEGIKQSHLFQTKQQYHDNLKKTKFDDWLLGLVAPVSAEQFREGRIIRSAREAIALAEKEDHPRSKALVEAEAELQRLRVAQKETQHKAQKAQLNVETLVGELADLRAELTALRAARPATATEKSHDELAAELERAWDENKQLRAETRGALRQLADLENDFRNYIDSSVLLWQPPDGNLESTAPSDANGVRLETIADVLEAAATLFADVMVVWDDARRSAEESLYPSPAKVFQALEAIADVARAYFKARNGGPPLGPIDRAFVSRVPFKYTSFESQTTLSLFGAERVFRHNGESRQMQRHLTLGGGTTNSCLQIYFDFDHASQRVLIGYCGRHLPYARQRT